MSKILYLVIPAYNEEEVLEITAKELTSKFNGLIKEKKIDKNSKVLFVDDGSKDNTWKIINKLHKDNNMFIGLKLAHNKGHQNALLAGLMYVIDKCDISISMDCDLQDDIHAIDKMILEYDKGAQIVYGVRSARKKDTFFKKFTAEGFYKFMRLMGVDLVFNHADYRLMSNKALLALKEYDEVNLFLRGIIPDIGFKTAKVYYERDKRVAGTSKYPLKKMIKFAIDGITSFTIVPLRLITSMGFIMAIMSFIMLIYTLIVKLTGNTVSGWAFIVISIWLVAGVQMISLGVIGEYIGKIYKEVKHRPRYIIEEELK